MKREGNDEKKNKKKKKTLDKEALYERLKVVEKPRTRFLGTKSDNHELDLFM